MEALATDTPNQIFFEGGEPIGKAVSTLCREGAPPSPPLSFAAGRANHAIAGVWASAAASIHMISQTLPSGSSTWRLNMKPRSCAGLGSARSSCSPSARLHVTLILACAVDPAGDLGRCGSSWSPPAFLCGAKLPHSGRER